MDEDASDPVTDKALDKEVEVLVAGVTINEVEFTPIDELVMPV